MRHMNDDERFTTRWSPRGPWGRGEGRTEGPDESGQGGFGGDAGGGGRRGHGAGRGHGGRGGPFGGPFGTGFGGGFGSGFGPGPGFGPGGPGGPRGRGRGRARRGDVRQAILSLLAEGSANGYGLIKAIEERTGGVWRTSPGSVYPTLAQLTDEGLIAPVEGQTGSGTTYALTEAGGTYVTENAEELAKVWAPASETWAEVGDMMLAGRKLVDVLRQVATNGTDEQRATATAKMDDLRRELYRMLGE